MPQFPPPRPLNVMFIITSMPVGGAETLLVNMMRRFDRRRIAATVCCLKERGELGEQICGEFPVYANLIHSKFDVAVVGKLRNLFKEQAVDAVVTIGAGDKMFWGRLAARYGRVPVILSALHSTGWPDGVGTLNRLLTGITSGFVAVAKSHGEFLVDQEGFPAEKVFVIPNGIDAQRFQFNPQARGRWRQKLGIRENDPVTGIVAALRQEKDHLLFLRIAKVVRDRLPNSRFVIAGDGPERGAIEASVAELGLQNNVHLLGTTHDIPAVLSMMDLFALTSRNEASPVSILEAMSCQRVVVAPAVGSIGESVLHNKTGLLVPAGDVHEAANSWLKLLTDQELTKTFGAAGREHVVRSGSLNSMTRGYTELIESLFQKSAKKLHRGRILNDVTVQFEADEKSL